MNDLAHFIEPVEEFAGRAAPFKAEVFAWFLHEIKQMKVFQAADIGTCFDEMHIPRPPNIPTVLTRLCEKRPARLIKDSKGYRLSAPAREEMAKLLPVRAWSVRTTQILTSLLDRVSNPVQRTFLSETLVCFRHGAYRASIVMAWNLAFAEVLDRILITHLTEFNAQLSKVHPKAALVTKRSDFEELKESKIIEIARGAGILSGSTAKILSEKLAKRNTVAHPSVVTILPVTAEEVIADLVENVILPIAW